MISLNEALAAYQQHLGPLPPVCVPLEHALGLCLQEDTASLTDLPRFDQSAMDGYALRSGDTEQATDQHPLELQIAGRTAAGETPADNALPTNTAWRIFTGAAIPAGADTVVPQERVEANKGTITLKQPCPAARNIRYQGEELRRDDIVGKAGSRLTPGLIAALIMAGHKSVNVVPTPRISLIITGDELRDAGSALKTGEIHDSNGPLVTQWLQSQGLSVAYQTRLSDSQADIQATLDNALQTSDLVITTGGASVGAHDFLPAAARQCGVEQIFWKVAQKPGKPIFFGTYANTPGQPPAALLCLPGNPGAVLIGLCLHVYSVLNIMSGHAGPALRWQHGQLKQDTPADKQRTRLVRMQQRISSEGQIELQPMGRQDSHMMSNLSQADVLVRIDAADTTCKRGTVLPFIPIYPGMAL